MKRVSRVIVFFRFISFFSYLTRNEACLDVLTKAFNEIFSPIVETGERRLTDPHKVDDLTSYYETDKQGNIYLKNPEYDDDYDGEEEESPENNGDGGYTISGEIEPEYTDPYANGPFIQPRNSPDKDETAFAPQSTNVLGRSYEPRENGEDGNGGDEGRIYFQFPRDNYNYNKRRNRSFYTPGQRPIMDFLIKIMEMFQLTKESKYINVPPTFNYRNKYRV